MQHNSKKIFHPTRIFFFLAERKVSPKRPFRIAETPFEKIKTPFLKIRTKF